MPWLIGIDEAGYGPNLGPLVQTAVGVRVPAGQESCDLWQTLAGAVRKQGGRSDGRLVIDDSKKVYGPSHSLRKLELGVLATLGAAAQATIGAWVERVAPASLPELRAEAWFVESDPVPAILKPEEYSAAAERFRATAVEASISDFWVRSRITPTPLFNTLLDELDNKANVLTHGLCWLLREASRPNGDAESISFAIDRQGGRRYHAALIENSCPEGWVETLEESDVLCRYRMNGQRELSWSFEVEAESRHFTVALASMVSKYMREILMAQFNRYWQQQVAGLKPTAGYPVDAARFIADIRPAMQRLGIEERLVWRRK